MPCASLSLHPSPTGPRSAGYAGGSDPCGQSNNQDGTMGDSLVSLSWHLQGSYLGALGTWPWAPTFMGAQGTPRSPAPMATFHRTIMRRD